MATPRRRSARLQSETPSRPSATPLSKLSSLLERDDSPPSGAQPNINAIVSSPIPPPNTAMAGRFDVTSSTLKTPQTVSRFYSSLEEMHPNKVHQSTVKPSPSRCDLGSISSRLSVSPSKRTIATVGEETPSRSKGSLPIHMDSPKSDFSFERPESDLSKEAQKIMESVREEAAKIKAQMLEERNRQEEKDGETEQLCGVGGRMINKPKGKCGRYSNIHKQEFKKMESITNHASLWKTKIQDNATLLKRSPSKADLDQAYQANTSSLKRSPSKAGLDQPDKPLSRTKSFKSFGSFKECREKVETTSPGKRAKQRYGDDASAARPVSRDTELEFEGATTTPVKMRTHSGLPSAVTTPTKASLARAASVKHAKTYMIPSLSRSAFTKTLKSPTMAKTEPSNKYFSSLSRFGNMKSILHRSQPKYSNDPTKAAAGTHIPLQQDSLDLDKDLPGLPGSPCVRLHRSPTIKRVGFALNTKSLGGYETESPSISKIPIPYTQSQPEVSTPPPITIDPVSYPDLANTPNITTRTKIPRASTPGDFTFRAEKSIDFSPSKDTTFTSPGSTIRHVRPSGVPTHVPSFDTLPAIPHGMPNKKRSRCEPDNEAEDIENVDPIETDDGNDDQPRAKRQCMSMSPEKRVEAQSPSKRRTGGFGGSRIPKFGGANEKGRKGLSLGRLNMLASPTRRY
ncbi:hypothetical protein N7G274_004256 [Stereocaulon virgatum]|uniref:Uncharacterized protein n=1 Tax=Stereocaulon virgatum TaxID=373712 RepID=A0ABR4ACJ4_9LECA